MNKKTGVWTDRVRRLWRFLVEDVWDIELSSLSAMRRFGVKSVRVVHLVAKGFREDQCPLHASALTFWTLMSIVPVLAVSFALARGFGAADRAERIIREKLGVPAVTTNMIQISGPKETSDSRKSVVQSDTSAEDGAEKDQNDSGMTPDRLNAEIGSLVTKVFDYVRNISFAKLGGFGLLLLLWSVVSALQKLESSFNRVWGVTSGRPVMRRLFDYLGILVVLPMLVVAASSLPIVEVITKFVNPSVAAQIRHFVGSGSLKMLVVVLMTTLTFTFLLVFMPNTKVGITAGLAGGVVTAILFLLLIKLCIWVQVGVANSSAIYGSFAVVPILLMWVFFSWEIVLFGAEVAFALQNCTTYRMETRARAASIRSKLILALSVLKEAARAMIDGGAVFEISKYAREKRVPVRLLNEVIGELVQHGFLARLSDREGCFALLRSPDTVGAKDVFDAMLRSGAEPQELGLSLLAPEIEQTLSKADAGMAEALREVSIRHLVTRT